MVYLPNICDFINLKDKNGTTLMNVASSKKDDWYIILLWAAGANLEDDYTKEILLKQLSLHPLGIQHLVECPALVHLLETWDKAANDEEEERAEQKINALFGEDVKLIFIPTFEMGEEKRKELRRVAEEWNRCHDMKGEDKRGENLPPF